MTTQTEAGLSDRHHAGCLRSALVYASRALQKDGCSCELSLSEEELLRCLNFENNPELSPEEALEAIKQAPTSAPQPPRGPEWLHEIKHDGFRVIARRARRPTGSMTRTSSFTPSI